MSLIIGNVLPLRDRIFAKAVIDERASDHPADVFDRVMDEVMALPHGSVVDVVSILSGGDISMLYSGGTRSSGTMWTNRFVRCDGTEQGIAHMAIVEAKEAPEEVQESGVRVVGQLQDGFRAVASVPDAASIGDAVSEVLAAYDEDGTIAGLPPLSMIEVHGPVSSGGRAVSSSRIMERYMVVIGEDGTPYPTPMAPVVQPGGDDGGSGGGDDSSGNDFPRRSRSAEPLDAGGYQVGDDVRQDRADEPADGPADQGEEGVRRDPSSQSASISASMLSRTRVASSPWRMLTVYSSASAR